MQIPVINASAVTNDEDLAFACEALNDTLMDCARDWGVTSNAVVFYGRLTDVKKLDGQPMMRVASVVDDLSDAPGAEAYHAFTGSVAYSRTLADPDFDVVSVGLDHENKEELIDPHCDGLVIMPDGRWLAKEVCDPVQGDVRRIEARIGDVTRMVAISNYVLPSYFDKTSSGPFDAFGLVRYPFEIRPGGYQEIIDPETGGASYVFGKNDLIAANALTAKRLNPSSRLFRRIARRDAAINMMRMRVSLHGEKR